MSRQALLPEAKRQAAVSRITRTLLISILLASLQLSFGPIFAPQMITNSAQATTPEMIQSGLALDINASNATDRGGLTSGGSPAYTSTGGGYYTLSSASSQYLMNSTTPVTQGDGNKFSVFMWVYPTAAGQLLSHLGQAQINASYHTSIIDYTNLEQMIFGLWRSQGGQGTVTSTIATPKNNWYHIGLVYDGTKITAYINGVSAGTSADFVFSPPTSSYFGIGAIDSTVMVQPAGYGNMRFGSLSVYNRELPGSEVSTNFASTTGRFGPTVSSPSNVSTFANKSATFSTSTCSNTTSGSATCNYQWQLSTDAGTTWSFISGATSNTYTTPVLTSSYNGYRYRLFAWDPGTGVTAASDLYTISSAATLSVAVPPGSETDTALTFGANKYAWVADSNELDVTSAITMQAWVYQTEANSFWNMVMNKENSYQLGTFGSVWSFGLQGSGGWSGVQTGVPTRLNEWQHVALTRAAGSSTANFYLNGQLAWTGTADGASTGDLKNSSQPFTISGRSSDGLNFSSPFLGRVDEVKVFRSARSQSEIVSDMHTYGPINSTNLILYYDFNEGTGSVLFNRTSGTSTASDLSIVGSPAWVGDLNVSTYQAYTFAKFSRSYLTAAGGWKVPNGVTRVTALTVAGGGGGGSRVGGGGGGGGYSLSSILTLTPNQIETITVGQGGLGAQRPIIDVYQGRDGQNSFLGSRVTVTGGGGGGGYNTSSNTEHAGRSGGSGGGAAPHLSTAGTWPAGVGTATSGQGFNGGSGFSGTGYPAGGGGGAAGIGGTATSTSVSGAGGSGILDPLTGSNLCFASGGGGGVGNLFPGSTGGAAGSCSGGITTASAGTKGQVIPSNASANSGSGGGGAGYVASNSNDVAGGNGGSGVIIIRWITATAPIFTGPSSDTLTAGMVETFTVSNNPNLPLTRNFRWQVSSDTGTTWVNASTGTGFTSASYTTPILETTTSGIRYQYRVVVTDSDTAGLFIVETSTATVFLTINPRITITGSSVSLTQKYGQTQSVTYTIANGTGTRTTATPSIRTGITWSSVSGSSATLGIGPGLGFGTYYETLTVTDSVTATTTQMITIAVSKADTITVTMDTITALTFTGSAALTNPSVTISGLSSADTATVQYNYEGSTLSYNATSSGLSCANGGTCALGDLAPGGGRVFYVSATKINAAEGVSDGGIYLATGPDSWWTAAGIPSYIPTFGCTSTILNGTYTDTIGSGAENTRQLMTNSCAQSAGTPKNISTSTFGGYSDWFVPSLAELQVLYTNLYAAGRATVPAPGWNACTYWSSNPFDAISQYGMRVACNGVGATATSNKNNSSGQSMYAMPIRAFSPLPTSSSTAPTNAGNYTALPVNFTIASPSSLANYQGVTVLGRSFTINKANQARLTIGQYDAFPGISTYPINVYGGTGLGAVTRTLVTTGTANCTLTNSMFLSATNQGTCSVRAVKSGGINYLDETTTATIYWIQFVTNYANGAAGGATGITLTGETAIEKRSYETFTVLSFANGSGSAVTSASVGSVLRVIGTGFNASDSTTEVFFGMTSVPASSLTFNVVDPLANYVQLTVPADAETDRVVMRSKKGWATSPGTLTITP